MILLKLHGMFVNLNIPRFGKLLRKYVYSFKNRLETSDNIIIHGVYSSQFLLFYGFGGMIYCRVTILLYCV